jgi:Papain-like cysteine protease AvrRpt2
MIGNLPLKSLEAAVPTSTGTITKIDFKVSHQKKDQWCWAAVASSVANYYHPGSGCTQCEVASKKFKVDCSSDKTGICDKMLELDEALALTGNLKESISAVLDTDKITAELQKKHPVCIRVYWREDSGGHFLVITGVYQDSSDGSDHLILSDPIYNDSDCLKSKLVNGFYQHQGQWTDTYLTEA